jgi:hypothetical protein
MAPDEARRARGAVKELMIGRITPPFLGITEDSVEQAKTTYPIQSHMFIRTFHMEITGVWFSMPILDRSIANSALATTMHNNPEV